MDQITVTPGYFWSGVNVNWPGLSLCLDGIPNGDAQRMMALSGDPKRLWVVDASDHRFSNNLSEFDRSLLAAIDWVTQHAPR